MKMRLTSAFCCAALYAPALLATVSQEEAAAIATAWRGQNVPVAGVATYGGATTGAFHVVTFASGGFVAVSAKESASPVMAFSTSSKFTPSAGNPLWTLLREDADARERSKATPKARPVGAIRSVPAASGIAAQTSRAGAAASALDKIYDERVAPLLQSKWNQAAVNGATCYNYYTPHNYYCGCVATAGAQIMRYHRHPSQEVAQKTYYTGVQDPDTKSWSFPDLTTKGGIYSWDDMPLIPDEESELTQAQREAIGRLTYDVGVACTMYYGIKVSEAPTYMLRDCLEDLFQYGNADCLVFGYSFPYSLEGFKNAVVPSLEAGLPVALHIGQWSGDAHAVVADGYGYSADGDFYLHINMGWSGGSDGWYAPPDIAGYGGIPIIIYNIEPDGDDGSSFVAGRVFLADGSTAEGATVTAYDANGRAACSCTTGNGDYLMALESGEYTLVATCGYQRTTSPLSVSYCINVTGNSIGEPVYPEEYDDDNASSELVSGNRLADIHLTRPSAILLIK